MCPCLNHNKRAQLRRRQTFTLAAMRPIFRKYKSSDYSACEALVNEAWAFDKNFPPQELADIAKCLYTKGSVVGSNYQKVVEIDGHVVGFIFGLNEMKPHPKGPLLFGLSITWRLLRTKHTDKDRKKALLVALSKHQANRAKILGKDKSEIVLFVVAKEHQGLGYGQTLLSEFLAQCKTSGVHSVIVETNTLGASGFYEKIGFQHLANFDSPLHAYATRDGQACLYEYKHSN